MKAPARGPLSYDDGALDQLYAELRRTRDADAAASLAVQIREVLRKTARRRSTA